MRRKALVLTATLCIVIIIAGALLLDRILDWSLENSMETITGAKVEIDQLHFDIGTLTISIGRLQLANPRNTWRNIVETRHFSAKMLPEPLYSGKVVIEKIRIDDLAIDTPRQTDGKLKKKPLPGVFGKAQKELNRNIASMPILDLNQLRNGINPDQLLQTTRLNLDSAADNLHSDVEATGDRWKSNIRDLVATKDKVENLNLKFKALKNSKPSNVLEIRNAIAQINELKKDITVIEDHLSETNNRFEMEFTKLSDAIHALKAVADGDFRALLKLAKIPDFESFNLAEALFGKAFLERSSPVVMIMDQLRTYVPPGVSLPEKEEHPRGGQDIPFPGRKTYPRFLIKEIAVTGRGTTGIGLQGYRATGNIHGITSEPLIYGQPLEAAILGQSPHQAYLDLKGSLNQLSKDLEGQARLTIGNLSMPTVDMPKSPYLPEKITSGKADIITKLTFAKEQFQLHITLDTHNLISDFHGKPEPSDLGMEIVREVLTRVDRLQVDYDLKGYGDDLKMEISSNLDTILKERFKEVVGEKIAEAAANLRAKLDAKLAKHQQTLETLRVDYKNQYQTKLSDVQKTIDEYQSRLEEERNSLEEKLRNNLGNDLLRKLKP